uniref:Branchpoint-bridging protein n=1 Tax=Caenorhabditis tropicalis TaxID=1561998 RepID=A0A1I7U8Q1_9PELO
MSIFEFVMSVAINVITIIVVIVFFSRLSGSLISTRPKHSKRRRRKHVTKVYLDPDEARRHSRRHYRPSNPPELHLAPPPPIHTAAPYLALDSAALFTPKPKGDVIEGVPDWRREWPTVPDVQLQRHLKQKKKEDMRRMGYNVPPGPGEPSTKLDFYAPEPDQIGFPWKYKTMNETLERRKETQAERIKKLYYQHWPEDLPNMPMEMRRRMQEERERMEMERNKSKLKGRRRKR